MIPSTLLGLLLFVLVLGPGYVWLRYTETRVSRADRSGVLEAADVIFVGALATGLSAVAVLVLGPSVFGLPGLPEILGADPLAAEQLAKLIWGGVLVILLAVVGTLIAAYLFFGGREKLFRQDLSIWQFALGTPGTDKLVVVSVELRDGRFVEGLLMAHTIGDSQEEKQIALRAPLKIYWPAAAPGTMQQGLLPADRMIISASEIVTISAKDVASAGSEPVRKRLLRRPWRPGDVLSRVTPRRFRPADSVSDGALKPLAAIELFRVC